MCRSTEDPRWRRKRGGRDRLNMRAFYVRFSMVSSSSSNKLGCKGNELPQSLTLHYLPRISGSPLDIDDAPIPSDSSTFLTLHRVTSHCYPLKTSSVKEKEMVFASRERVRASEGVRFQVLWREEKILKGVFRRKEQDDKYDHDLIKDFKGEWKLDCKCAVDNHMGVLDNSLLQVSDAQVCIEIREEEGHGVMMSDKVEMAVRRNNSKMKKKNNSISISRGGFGVGLLEEIPEQREVDDDNETDSESLPYANSSSSSSSSSSCRCCCGAGGDLKELELELELRSEAEGEESGNEEQNQGRLELEIEGVRWAVDVGMWAMCFSLGVGCLVSVASLTGFRRPRPRSYFR